MKYDYLVVRESLVAIAETAARLALEEAERVKDALAKGGEPPAPPNHKLYISILADIEKVYPNVEVLNVSVLQSDDGELYAYAACRVPEQRKAGTK